MQAAVDGTQLVYHCGGRLDLLGDEESSLDLSQDALGLVLRRRWAGCHLATVPHAAGGVSADGRRRAFQGPTQSE